MKVETVKETKLAYTVDECNLLDSVTELLITLTDVMSKENCDIISGNYYEEEINISKSNLVTALNIISNIKYTTEMF